MIVLPVTTREIPMETILANSYRDFHLKGFDYICLRRSPLETVKLYFFDGDVSKMPEVVSPHDHRYDFSTLCVAGTVQNKWFEESKDGEVFNRFAYDTPLLGGTGFSWVGETKLAQKKTFTARAGRRYMMKHDEIHTIQLMENETVICLVQYEDRVAVDQPTLTFIKDREPPSLDGLYQRFTADGIRDRMRRLKERAPEALLPRIV